MSKNMRRPLNTCSVRSPFHNGAGLPADPSTVHPDRRKQAVGRLAECGKTACLDWGRQWGVAMDDDWFLEWSIREKQFDARMLEVKSAWRHTATSMRRILRRAACLACLYHTKTLFFFSRKQGHWVVSTPPTSSNHFVA